jgi:hypothetical protein
MAKDPEFYQFTDLKTKQIMFIKKSTIVAAIPRAIDRAPSKYGYNILVENGTWLATLEDFPSVQNKLMNKD